MSYPFNLLLGYSILSSFNDNYPLYPHPQEKTWTAAWSVVCHQHIKQQNKPPLHDSSITVFRGEKCVSDAVDVEQG